MSGTVAHVSEEDRIVTTDLGPGMEWVCEMEWPEGVTQGGPAVLVIRPSDPENYPAGGISSTVLREIDFRDAAKRLRRQLAMSDRRGTARERYEQDLSERLRALLSEGVSEKYLANLSSAYVSLTNRGQAKPLERLAEMTGKSAAAIKNHLWQATRKGFLERSAGRAGGKLTEKSIELLDHNVRGFLS